MKKDYLSPTFDFVKLRMESIMEDIDPSSPQIPVVSGDPGEAN